MKALIILLFFLSVSCDRNANITSSQNLILTNNSPQSLARITSITTTKFYSDFNDIDTQKKITSIIEYDSIGNVTNTTEMYIEGKNSLESRGTDTYNSNGTIRSQKTNDSSGNLTQIITYTYNSDKKIREKYINNLNSDISYYFKYDYFSNGYIKYLYKYSIYNNFKQLIAAHTYNKSGDILKVSTTDFRGESDSIVNQIRFNYTYDSIGNWIEKFPTEISAEYPSEFREITYNNF